MHVRSACLLLLPLLLLLLCSAVTATITEVFYRASSGRPTLLACKTPASNVTADVVINAEQSAFDCTRQPDHISLPDDDTIVPLHCNLKQSVLPDCSALATRCTAEYQGKLVYFVNGCKRSPSL
ncbi:hypothetical protein GQ42DRAFT_152199 [Ramicandelaber brevisporus]|nr:hypothetical protein GQ42DRAFT_152199 [Ramicandelaber brevisporus]